MSKFILEGCNYVVPTLEEKGMTNLEIFGEHIVGICDNQAVLVRVVINTNTDRLSWSNIKKFEDLSHLAWVSREGIIVMEWPVLDGPGSGIGYKEAWEKEWRQ